MTDPFVGLRFRVVRRVAITIGGVLQDVGHWLYTWGWGG